MEQVSEVRPASSPDAVAAGRPRPLWKEIARHWQDYLFISPFFITFAIFGLYPLLWAIRLSFSKWRGTGEMTWVGLENYRVVLNDPYLWQTLANTIMFTLILLPTGIFIAIVLAVILNNELIQGRGAFRTIYFMPYVTSSVIVAIVFIQLFDDRYGWVNAGLQSIGLPAVRWLRGSEWAARIVIVLLVHWGGIGYNILLFLGGLQGIESELYDAAKVDGATDWNVFWSIQLPLLKPIIFFLTIVATIGLMNLFNQVYMLTRGGPQGATRTVMYRLYEIGFVSNRYGDASAFGVLMGILILIIAIFQTRQSRRFMN
jgi:ABC-type sugar transport system permease subunit